MSEALYSFHFTGNPPFLHQTLFPRCPLIFHYLETQRKPTKNEKIQTLAKSREASTFFAPVRFCACFRSKPLLSSASFSSISSSPLSFSFSFVERRRKGRSSEKNEITNLPSLAPTNFPLLGPFRLRLATCREIWGTLAFLRGESRDRSCLRRLP